MIPELPVAGQEVLAPKLWVYLGRSGRWAPYPTAGIVDTGSAVTLVAPEMAYACGVSDDEIAAGEPQDVEGLGGDEPVPGHLLALDLALVADQKELPEDGLILRNCRVVVAAQHPELILGQHDFLERLRFEQRSYHPERAFELQQFSAD